VTFIGQAFILSWTFTFTATNTLLFSGQFMHKENSLP